MPDSVSGRLSRTAVAGVVLSLLGLPVFVLAAPRALGPGLYGGAFDEVVTIRPAKRVLLEYPRLSRYLFGRTPVIEGGDARRARFRDPSSVLAAPDGRIFVSDRRDHRIRVIADGRIRTFVGTGTAGYSGDGGPRGDAEIRFPEGLAMSDGGDLVFADALNHRIRTVSAEGRVRTIAGDGRPGFSGDGGPAEEGSLRRPSDVCVARDGSIFIADVGNHAIRRVAPDGIMTTVAGSGAPGFSGDGGPGTEARLHDPWGIDCLPDGGVLIADSENHRIRELTSEGTIVTVAGTGNQGSAGDGLPASAADFNSPQEVVADDEGGFLVVDEHNHRIRHIDSQGFARGVAGTGEMGRSPDGTLATRGKLNDPEDVSWLGESELLIADGDNGRILKKDSADTLRIIAGR